MNTIDREAIYIALGTDHAGQPLEQPGTSTATEASNNPVNEHVLYLAEQHNSSNALLDSLTAERREGAVKPH